MPPARSQPIEAPPLSIDFRFLVSQIHRKLKAEGRGRDRVFDHEIKRQLAKAVISQRKNKNPLLLFKWRLFEGTSNHFWPGSVIPADRPLGIMDSRPYVDISKFKLLNPDALSFEELIDFIQYNGETSHCWPRKSLKQWRQQQRQIKRKRRRERLRELGRPGNTRSNPIILSPSPIRIPRPALAQEVMSIGMMARSMWDEGITMTQVSPPRQTWKAPFIQPQIPTLSFVCRSGWDLNKNAVFIPDKRTGHDIYIAPEKGITDKSSDSDQTTPLGNVSFTRVPEKDIEAFLNKFLGRAEVVIDDTNKI
ncbi:hypothetical protein GGR58DRAFT_506725 [Xylaria digitata]|nr:hypothetical protein GGR58DRAFT_506725 [Xylaria digitata]